MNKHTYCAALILTTLLFSIAPIVHGQDEIHKDLEKAQAAYTEAKSLGHKATTFIHARSVYRAARKHYLKTPIKLASYAFAYANAAGEFNDPIALKLHQNALEIYAEAYGIDNHELTSPLIYAAEEALKQNENEIAYAWLQNASDLLTEHFPIENIALSRVYMGKARLYLSVGDIEKASIHGHKSIEVLASLNDSPPMKITASLYHWLGEIERSAGNNLAALNAYSKSLDIFQLHDSEAREIYDLHKRLLEINHKLGREETAAAHCKNAMNYRFGKRDTSRKPFYDPNGKLSGEIYQKQGKIRATLVKGADCRLRNIEIHHTIGVTHAEALSLLKQAYYAPIIMHGKISDGEYSSLITIDVYNN